MRHVCIISELGTVWQISILVPKGLEARDFSRVSVHYVVPPLEGFWWQENTMGVDYSRKEDFHFISLIRLPDFVTKEDFGWAVKEASEKKKTDFSKVEFFTYDEGLCVQCMHIGPYDDEPATVERMHEFMEAQGYRLDITEQRFHHEIYLSDARRTEPEKLKTVIRHPIAEKEKQERKQYDYIC